MKKGVYFSYTLVVIALALLIIISIIRFVKSDLFSNTCRTPKEYKVKVIKVLKRDESSYTQGFFIHDGLFYESFGQYGQSGRKSYKIGESVNQSYSLNSAAVFAEGMAVLDNEIIQLTWKKQRAMIDTTALISLIYTEVGFILYKEMSVMA